MYYTIRIIINVILHDAPANMKRTSGASALEARYTAGLGGFQGSASIDP